MVTDSKKVIVALDFPDAEAALRCAAGLGPELCRVKVGMELFTAAGPDLVRRLQDLGYEVFLDLKFHDIPATVARAVQAAARLGVWMVNVHALGGPLQLRAASEALAQIRDGSADRTLLIAVTILTSMDDSQLAAAGIFDSAGGAAVRLARMSRECGLDGVVCSALECAGIRQACGDNFICVTPGIRPAGSRRDDQVRIVTPPEAISLGSDYLVIGRPITRAENPAQVLRNVVMSLGGSAET